MMGSNQSVEYWRPVRESNPRGRREREATCCNSKELRGMDSTLPHLKDSWERLLDSQWTRALRGCRFSSAVTALEFKQWRSSGQR